MPIIEDSSKNFENPNTGRYYGTIIDVVDLGKKTNSFGKESVRLRIFWVLNQNDSTGSPLRAFREVNAKITDKPKKSALYEVCEGVLGQAPPLPFDTDHLIGRSNELVIVREKDAKTNKEYSNIKVILPLPAGVVPPPIPQGYVRFQNRPTTNTNQLVTSAAPPVQVATPPSQVQAVAANPPQAHVPQNPEPQPTVGAPVVDARF